MSLLALCLSHTLSLVERSPKLGFSGTCSVLSGGDTLDAEKLSSEALSDKKPPDIWL